MLTATILLVGQDDARLDTLSLILPSSSQWEWQWQWQTN
jgi:hypothetical protein